MAENDIYDSKRKYENFLASLEDFLIEPQNSGLRGKRKYYCKNKENIAYFRILDEKFSARDLSYVRRLRLFSSLKLIVFSIEKNLKEATRDDIDQVMRYMHTVYKSVKTKKDFIVDIKHIWKLLFPEMDEQGRIDEDIVPYPVRHLKSKDVDRSLEKRRNDKLTVGEFEKVVQAFSQDVRMQAYLTLSFESLGRPQEILFTKIKDVELYDNYGKIWISEHGKEGTGFLEVIDSYPYIAEWFNKHPLRNDPDAFFFLNLGNLGRYKQLKPHTINKHLQNKLKVLKINKPVTCYSLKRSGVTYRRLRGDSDLQIQHTARWTSTKQLKTYDLSQHDDTFKLELIKRGIIEEKTSNNLKILSNKCMFCETVNGIGTSICKTCKRPLDRKKIINEIQERTNRIDELEKQINNMPQQILELLKESPELLQQALNTKT